MSEDRRRLLISGRVQGVGFRAFVAHKARAAGLRGFVRNLRDGRVEAVLSGEAAKVEAVQRACEEGPLGSFVERVEIAAAPDMALAFPFEVRRDG